MSNILSLCRRSGGVFSIPLVLALSIIASTAAHAQLEEIVVTATKREGSLQDAPLAVSAFTGDQMDRQGINNTLSLSNAVPNLNVATETAREAVFINIRGVSQSERRNTGDPTTSFYVDGVYVSRMSGVNAYFYDVDRVEVLRGPQGTLYGRNSTSGVVNVHTKMPDTEAVGGFVDATLGNYNWAQFRGALNIPFSDNVAGRVSFIRNKRDGYRDNAPAEDGDDADDTGVRGHLMWNIGDDTSLLLSADYYTRKGVGGVAAQVDCRGNTLCDVPVAPDPADTNPLNTTGSRDNKDTNFSLQLDHSFTGVDLNLILARRNHDREAFFDNDYMGVPVSPGGLVPSGFLVDTLDAKADIAELRLTSNSDGPFRWIAGLFYLDEELDAFFAVQPMLPNGLNISVEFPDQGFTSESKAAYADVAFDVSEAMTLNAGIRYTEDEKNKGGFADLNRITEGSFNRFQILQTGGRAGPPNPRSQVSNPSWEETTWKVGLDWRVSDDALAYGKVSTGYKAGGFNRGSSDGTSGTPFIQNLVTYEPENITAYEAGYKTTLGGGNQRANFAAFYYDYTDLQQAVVSPINGILVNTTINAADSTIWGLELEYSIVYGDSGGQLDFNIGYLDATFDTFVGTDDPITPGQDNLDLSGGDMINAPDWNFTVNWQPAEWDLWGGTLSPLLTVHYESSYISRVHAQPVDQQDSFTRSNASLYWESGDSGMYGEVFVNNIEDEDIVTWSACGTTVNGAVTAPYPGVGCNQMFAAPRTYGARLGYRF